MAMVTCGECGKTMSDRAAVCPACGNPAKVREPVSKVLVLAVLAVLGVVVADMYSVDKGASPLTDEVPLTPEQAMARQFAAQFDLNGEHRELRRYLLRVLNDPDSYQHVQTVARREGDGLVVLVEYRAKNRFGGVVVDMLKARCDADGNCNVIFD